MAKGKVILAGAGAGQADLVSLRVHRKLVEADVVVTDRLIDPQLLAEIDSQKIIYVGKEGGRQSVLQSEINDLLIRLADEGKVVVRLKGGDPLIFGRGGEELESLAAAGVEFEIIPGITAASVAASFAGIPLTHRDFASGVCFVTGHEDPAKDQSAIDYAALAKIGTIVFYMSVSRLEENLSALMAAGMSRETPGAIVEQAGSGVTRTFVAPVSRLAQVAEREQVRAPSLVIVGNVVGLREKLAWVEKRLLFGKTIVLTRPAERMAELRTKLVELGAQVLSVPTIDLEGVEDGTVEAAVSAVCRGEFDWMVLTSPKGAEIFLERLRALKLDARNLHRVKIAVIGQATGDVLRRAMIEPDLSPEVFTSEALTSAMIEKNISEQRVVLFRAELADRRMTEKLEAAGAAVTQVTAYRTKFIETIEPVTLEWLERSRSIDYVVFTSSSTVRGFFDLAEQYGLTSKIRQAQMISIGPVTSEEIRKHGCEVCGQAQRQDAEGIVLEILNNANRKAGK
jgi:uroporphyrinogen III methyltransferase/synthase